MELSRILSCLVLVLFASACHHSSSSGGSGGGGAGAGGDPALEARIEAETAKCSEDPPAGGGNYFRYIITNRDNGSVCTTGCRIYYSLSSYCEALRNDAENSSCGADTREEMYQESCN